MNLQTWAGKNSFLSIFSLIGCVFLIHQLKIDGPNPSEIDIQFIPEPTYKLLVKLYHTIFFHVLVKPIMCGIHFKTKQSDIIFSSKKYDGWLALALRKEQKIEAFLLCSSFVLVRSRTVPFLLIASLVTVIGTGRTSQRNRNPSAFRILLLSSTFFTVLIELTSPD